MLSQAEGYEHTYEMLLSFLCSLCRGADEHGNLRSNTLAVRVTLTEATDYLERHGMDGKRWLVAGEEPPA